MTAPRPVSALANVNGFRNRFAAGQVLAEHLSHYAHRENTLILALPRGGVPVGCEIAKALGLPLDVFLVRKVNLPDQPELAMGAIATGGVQLLDEVLINEAGISPDMVAQQVSVATKELNQREALYRDGRPGPSIAHRSIILVDDGVATGYTMRVAILALRQLGPSRLTVAIPVGAPETCDIIEALVDELICPVRPSPFHAVGLWYDHFPAVSDDLVRESLAACH
jgi:putative phosphoribosyl transferase